MDAISDDRALADAVRRVLLTEWDPVGLSDLPAEAKAANADEYDSYVQPLLLMLIEGAQAPAVAAHLRRIEARQMGLKPRFSRAATAAEALLAAAGAVRAQAAG